MSSTISPPKQKQKVLFGYISFKHPCVNVRIMCLGPFWVKLEHSLSDLMFSCVHVDTLNMCNKISVCNLGRRVLSHEREYQLSDEPV